MNAPEIHENDGAVKALADKLAEEAWHTLNHDNDPFDGQEHNTANWKLLRNRLWAVLKNHQRKCAAAQANATIRLWRKRKKL